MLSDYTLQIGDESITFKPLTINVENEFEQRLFNKTKKSLLHLKDMITPDEYIKLLRSCADAYALGQYKLLREGGLESIQKHDGVCVLLSILTGKTEEDAGKLLRSNGAEVGSLLNTILTDCLGMSNG